MSKQMMVAPIQGPEKLVGWSNLLENRTPHVLRIFRSDTPSKILDSEVDDYLVLALESAGAVRVKTIPQLPLGSLETIHGGTVMVWTAQDFSDELDWGPSGPPQYDGSGQLPAIVVGLVGAAKVDKSYAGPVLMTDTGPESVVRDHVGNVMGVRRLQKL